jgi:hypothetical protein
LVRTHDCDPPERFKVCELGEITAPAELDGVGLDLATSQRILCDLQHAVVTVQQRALKAKAALMRQVDPTLSLKDYRRRSVQTLFGTLKIRVPRLVRRGSRLAPPCLFRNSARSNTEYDELRSRLGAFMSYRMAERLVGDLFPFAVGRASSTTRRQVLRSATHLDAGSGGCAFGDRQTAASIDLGIDTTFIRSNSAQSPRHHEILIGVGANDQGKVVKAGAVLSVSDKPHGLIERALHDLGQADAARVTAFTDDDQMLREYLKKAGVAADPILDWQHLSRRVQIAKTTAKGLGCLTNAERRARPLIAKALESLHWRLWHGHVDGACQAMARVFKLLQPFAIDRTRATIALAAKRLGTAMGKLRDYIEGQSAHLVDYGLRHRQGQSIGTATTEGLANSLVNQRRDKLQQMRWSAKGAHAVITLRARHFNLLENAAIAQRAAA